MKERSVLISMRTEHATHILAQVKKIQLICSMTNCYFVFSWLHMDLVKLERLHEDLRKRHKDEASEDSSGSHAWWKSLPSQCHGTWDVQRGCILSRLVSSNYWVYLCFSELCCKWWMEQLGSLFSILWRRTQTKEKGGGTGVKFEKYTIYYKHHVCIYLYI